MSQIEKTTKEKLLEEFDNKFIDNKYLSRTGMIPIYDTILREKLINFLYEAIDQTREETIKEVLKIIRDNYKPLQSEEVDNLYAILTIMVDNFYKLKK